MKEPVAPDETPQPSHIQGLEATYVENTRLNKREGRYIPAIKLNGTIIWSEKPWHAEMTGEAATEIAKFAMEGALAESIRLFVDGPIEHHE